MFLSKIKQEIENQLNSVQDSITQLFDHQVKQVNEIVSMKNLVEQVQKTTIRTNAIESIQEMQNLIKEEDENPKQTIVTLVGNAGLGKSTFLNNILGYDILPSDCGSEHVTKVLFNLSFDIDFSLEPILCTREEIRERCQETGFEMANLKPTSIYEQKTVYCNLNALAKAMTDIQKEMTESDIYHVKQIKVTAPIPALRDLGFEIFDVPGLHSGQYSKIYDRMVVEAGKLSDRIVIFPNSFRSEFPTDVFEIVGRIFNDANIQKNPKTFCYCYGGRTLTQEHARKEFLDCWSERTTQNIVTAFKRHLADYFDYKFDDIPRGPNERKVNDQIVFVENKRNVIEFLKDEFLLYPIPHLNSEFYEEEFNVTKLNFQLMLKKDKLIHLNRLTQKLREYALICIPKLISKSKFQTSKKRKEKIENIMRDCHETIKDIVKGLKKSFEKSRQLTKNAVNKHLADGFLVNCIDMDDVAKNQEKLITDHLKFMEEHIKALSTKHLKNMASREDLDMFSDAVIPLFDLNHEDHIVLASEMKGCLNDLFQTVIKKRNFNYEHRFDINFCDVRRDENNTSVLKLPTLKKYPNFKDMISAKIISNADSAAKANIYRNDKTETKFMVMDTCFPYISSIIDMNISKDLQIEMTNVQQDFNSFKNMIPSSTLLNHTQKTRISPIFFISLDGRVSSLAFNECWEKHTTESLIIIVTPKEHVSMFVDLVQQFSDPQHQVRILSVNVENGLYSEGSMMNAVFHFSSFFQFPISHIVKLNIKCLHEYISPLKEYVSDEWTPIRYFRSAEAVTYNEINSICAEEKTNIVERFLTSALQLVVGNNLLQKERISKLVLQQNVNCALGNIEGFIEYLRAIDMEVKSNLENNFKADFFSKNKGRVGCWDGLTRVIDKNKIYSRDGYNYMVSNYSTGIETYFLQAVDKILPVADDKFRNSLPEDYETSIEHGFDPKMISFRTNMLSNGVGGFLHFGFKYQVAKVQKSQKRKNTSTKTTTKKKKK